MSRAGTRNDRDEAEYQTVESAPMTPEELARIWRRLPEHRRLAFVLSLEEEISFRVIELTARKENDHD